MTLSFPALLALQFAFDLVGILVPFGFRSPLPIPPVLDPLFARSVQPEMVASLLAVESQTPSPSSEYSETACVEYQADVSILSDQHNNQRDFRDNEEDDEMDEAGAVSYADESTMMKKWFTRLNKLESRSLQKPAPHRVREYPPRKRQLAIMAQKKWKMIRSRRQ